jgi:cbb3-type cytochrome oxidase subunit 3
MDKISQKDIDWLLNLNKAEASYRPESSDAKKKWLWFSFWGLLIAGLGILPFFILIRTSIFLNYSFGWNGWLALAGGITATVLLLLLYVLYLFRKTSNKRLLLKFSLAGIGTLVFAFCFYGVLYISSVNAKNDEVRQVYRSLHPILRVAIATATFADGNLVITDIQRTPEDYAAMGISLNEGSLHFTQASGYVHAIDLRTIGHSEFRNFLLRTSLRIMGLKTIRHVGTADHLHVALPTPN